MQIWTNQNRNTLYSGNNFANFYKSQRRKEQIQEKRNALNAKKREGLISDGLDHGP